MSKQTTAQKLAAAEALVAKYKQLLIAEELSKDIVVGDKIDFNYGRADTRRVLSGSVTGTREDVNGLWVAVLVGEGFDATTYRIRSTDIVANADAAARKNAGVDPLTAD